jgi:uncharacterized protein (TIGR02145 family)
VKRAIIPLFTSFLLITTLEKSLAQTKVETNFNQKEISYKDERDGKLYETILINDLRWFKGNLRYVSKESFFRNRDSVLNTNFYSHLDAENVCPLAWRLPKFEEWKDYIVYIEKKQKTTKKKIKSTETSFRYFSKETDFFNKDNPLDIKKNGRVEKGELIIMFPGSDYWVEGAENKLTHVHFLNKGLANIHSHSKDIFEDNIVLRMFKVKCVCKTDKTIGDKK